MTKIALKNVVWKEGKYYVSQCLNVDVTSFGKTKKSAFENLDEALELYFMEPSGLFFDRQISVKIISRKNKSNFAKYGTLAEISLVFFNHNNYETTR